MNCILQLISRKFGSHGNYKILLSTIAEEDTIYLVVFTIGIQ